MIQASTETIIYDLDTVTQKTISTTTGQESSIEIKEDAKGTPRLTVKIYHADASLALDMAIQLYENGLKRLGGKE